MSQFMPIYLFVTLCTFGALSCITGQATPQANRRPGWHVRRWLLVMWAALLWPSTVILGAAWQFPVGRRYITRLLGGMNGPR